MTTVAEVSDVRAAAERFASAKQEREAARAALHDEIIAAARAKVRQAEIARASGYSRETIRRICRAAGIEPE